MKTNSPSKFHSIVAIVVFTLSGFVALSAKAQSNQTLDACGVATQAWIDKKITEEQKDKACNTASGNTCAADIKEYQTAFAKVKSLSPSTLERYRNCLSGTADAGRDDYITGDEDGGDSDGDGDGKPDDCAGFSVGCSAIEDMNIQDVLDDANERSQRAQKELLDTQKEARNAQKTMTRRMNQIKEAATQGERAYQLTMDTIQKELEAAMKSQDQALRDKVAALRKQITEKRNLVTQLNDTVRAAEDALANAKVQWEAGCRTDAYNKLNAIKAEIKKTNQEIKDKKIKKNYAGSSIAGASNRKEDREKRQMQTEYATAYKECIAGVSGVGAGAKSAVEAASLALNSTMKSTTERRATLQEEIKDLMSDFADLTTKSAEDKDTLRKMSESKLAAAQVAYQNSVEKMNREYAETQEDLSDAMQFGQQATAQAMQFANSAQMSLMGIQKQYQCTGGGGSKSRGSGDRVRKQWEDAIEADDKYELVCASNCTEAKNMCTKWDKAREENKARATGKGAR